MLNVFLNALSIPIKVIESQDQHFLKGSYLGPPSDPVSVPDRPFTSNDLIHFVVPPAGFTPEEVKRQEELKKAEEKKFQEEKMAEEKRKLEEIRAAEARREEEKRRQEELQRMELEKMKEKELKQKEHDEMIRQEREKAARKAREEIDRQRRVREDADRAEQLRKAEAVRQAQLEEENRIKKDQESRLEAERQTLVGSYLMHSKSNDLIVEYSKQLKELFAMGFEDVRRNLQVLKEKKGDLASTVHVLAASKRS